MSSESNPFLPSHNPLSRVKGRLAQVTLPHKRMQYGGISTLRSFPLGTPDLSRHRHGKGRRLLLSDGVGCRGADAVV